MNFILGFVFGLFLGNLIIMIITSKSEGNTEKVIYDSAKEIMTVYYSNGVQKEYSGSGTVWYELPLMKRCGTSKEYELVEYLKYCQKFGNPYPTAHLNKEEK